MRRSSEVAAPKPWPMASLRSIPLGMGYGHPGCEVRYALTSGAAAGFRWAADRRLSLGSARETSRSLQRLLGVAGREKLSRQCGMLPRLPAGAAALGSPTS
jgi:hypothetical protein